MNSETLNTATIVHPRLHHLGITTRNIDAMLSWYRLVLGMDLVHRTDSATGSPNGGPAIKMAWVTNDEANHRFGFVELPRLQADADKAQHGQREGARDGVEHLRRHVAPVALLQARVVRHRHPRQLRQLLAPQPLHPPVPPEDRQPDVFRLQPGAPGAQELAELRTPVQALAGLRVARQSGTCPAGSRTRIP
jgi:catechol 2,3-dioxygenase-like lactoylglutathione lyase family enzyme